MAGVLQTGAFINGEWISESLDINTVLKRNENKQPSELPKPEKPQGYGLLSQTVIESPIIRWILPVNIRGSEGDRDVAFISVSTAFYLQICSVFPRFSQQERTHIDLSLPCL